MKHAAHGRKLTILWLFLFSFLSLTISFNRIEARAEVTLTREIKDYEIKYKYFYGDYYEYHGKAKVVKVAPQITEMKYTFDGAVTPQIEAIIVPPTVKNIPDFGIYELPNLKYIIFLSNKTTLDPYAIRRCPKLVNIAAPMDSPAYKLALAEKIPVTTKTTPTFSKSKVFLLPSDKASMPLYNATGVQYSSSNPKIVTVDQNGKIKAKKKGSAVIKAKVGNATFSYKVKVYKKKQNERVKQIKKEEGLKSKKKSKLQKIMAAHDWLIRNVKYNYKGYLKRRVPRSSHTAQGALIKKRCVCDGYAKAFKKIMDSIKVPCKVVYGTGHGEGHAWNMVKVGGKWYHIDVTWDDPIIYGSNPEGNTTPHYTYFLKSTAYMKKNGHRFRTSRYPKCKSKKYDKKGLSSTGLYDSRGAYISYYNW